MKGEGKRSPVGRTDFKSVEAHYMSLVGSTPAPSANKKILMFFFFGITYLLDSQQWSRKKNWY